MVYCANLWVWSSVVAYISYSKIILTCIVPKAFYQVVIIL